MVIDLKKIAESSCLDLEGLKRISGDIAMDFPLRVTKDFLSRIKPGDINDPLLLQILPNKLELRDVSGFTTDPLEDSRSSPIPGLVQKYYGRVLLLTGNDCAVNCRFCFRQHLHEQIIDWQQVFSYIENDQSIYEVILSGGDPLMMKIEKLKEVLERLSTISHLTRIRIHSRVPIVMPERVAQLIILNKLPIVLVVHSNHQNEIDENVASALNILRQQDILLFNQSVLLRGINDNSETLIALSERLFSVGVTPYYLHLLDKVKGAAHFYVSIKRARQIHREMQSKISGYLVPKLVTGVGDGKRYI